MSTSLPLASGSGAAAVVERLAARQQQLAAEREQRQAQLQADSDAREDVSSFLSSYRSDLTQLQQRFAALQAATSTAAQGQDGAAKAALLEQLELLSVDVNSREHSISAASYFLPPYELRSCTAQLQQLRLQVADTKQQLQPIRKFAFSKAVAKTNLSTTAAAATAAAGAAAAPSTTQQLGVAAAGQATSAHAHASTGPSLQDQQLIAAGHGYAGLTGQLLVPSAQQLAGQGFVLHDLTDCQVFLLGRLSALRLQQLRNCRVYTAPVVGATFVDGCSGCTLMLASHQVRIHNATDCHFYLRVRSRPIIEHSSSLAFAPYTAESLLATQGEALAPAAAAAAAGDVGSSDGRSDAPAEQRQPKYQEQQQQQEQSSIPPGWQPAELLAAAQLSEYTDLWQQVDDFGWVKASASPNWSVLPEGQRQAVPRQLPKQQQRV